MRNIPVQMVILDLENGERGVFFGRPLVADNEHNEGCQVENVWFTNVQSIPESATLDELALLVIEQFNAQYQPLQ